MDEMTAATAQDHPGQLLRALRKSQNKRLRHIAESTGLSVSFLSDAERGRVWPSWRTMVKWADALGYEIEVSLKLK